MSEQQVTRINHRTQVSGRKTQRGRGAINARKFDLVRQYDLPTYGWRTWRLIMRSWFYKSVRKKEEKVNRVFGGENI